MGCVLSVGMRSEGFLNVLLGPDGVENMLRAVLACGVLGNCRQDRHMLKWAAADCDYCDIERAFLCSWEWWCINQSALMWLGSF